MIKTKNSVAVFGGGCFWCTEAVFKSLRGVLSVSPGYAGGETKNPAYEEVSRGDTLHAEVVRIEYNSEEISYESLLTVFFGSHDPMTKNRQGNDVGTQYRSIILYTDEDQKKVALKFIEDINNSNQTGASIVTEVSPLEDFYEAEDYHKNYYENNKNDMYCELVINPKLEKVQKRFSELLKENRVS